MSKCGRKTKPNYKVIKHPNLPNTFLAEFHRGHCILFDESDLDLFLSRNWSPTNIGGKIYLNAKARYPEESTNDYFHRLVMNPPKGMIIDHINQNTLDCKKSNLRICTNSQNIRNQKKRKKFKGVCHKGFVWTSQITVNYKSIHLGTFRTQEEAAKAYDKAAIKYHGEFASLNFPIENY